MTTPAGLRAVSPTEPVPSVKPDMTWWQKTAAGLLAMVVTTVCSFIGSHWGGVTNDQMNDALKGQEGRLGDRIDKAVLTAKKDSDDMKKYVDEKTAAPKLVAKKTKKKPPAEGSPSE